MPKRKTGRTTRKRRSFNAADHRDQPKIIADFLNDALATGDTVTFVKAIGDVTRAQGMTKVSQQTGLERRSLYKSFGGDVMPQFIVRLRTVSST